MEDLPQHIYRLGAALAIGLLIGLQREYAHVQEEDRDEVELFAGVRTFALFSMLGFLAALAAARTFSVLGFIVVFAGLIALVTISYIFSARGGSMGITTETAVLVTAMIGAICYWGDLRLAAVIGVLTTILLSLKVTTKSFVQQLTREDVYATLKFAFISIIVLPLLPREPLAPEPFDVLVPFNIWLMVVFISGIGFLGYALIKTVGVHRGVGLAGLLGGLASSTAVTVSFSQRSRQAGGLAHPFALAIMLSWSVMIVRVAVEVFAVNRALLASMWVPLAMVILCCLAFSLYLYRAQPSAGEGDAESFTNPFELKPAIVFGLLYAGILLAARAAQLYYGNAGIYLTSVISGLVDVDAITLTMARLSQPGGGLDDVTASRAIILAVVSNTLVKGGIAIVAGSVGLRKIIVPGILLIAASAVAGAFLLL